MKVFRGIPYARAPRGPLRWQPPQPVEPWSDVRPALRYGASSPQSPPAIWLVRTLVAASDTQSQDCLFLNVWTPATDQRRRPVLVWIHGGAFVLGSGSSALYDGTRLARTGDVVVVTLNYRLGALGFLDLSSVLPGRTVANAGLRDQIEALRWVRDNIEVFGGDPENVTLFGESAGGMSVGTLLGTPAAQGLFHRAICQSGAAHNVSSRDRARRVAEVFLEQLGARDLPALESAGVSAIVAAQNRTTAEMRMAEGLLPWQPSVDGDLLPTTPLEAIGKGIARDVPLLVGTNRNEWRLFMLADAKGRQLDDAGLARRLARALPGCDAGGRPLAESALHAYREMAGRELSSPADRWEAFQSDRVFHHPAHRLAALQSAQSERTFAYQFAWSPPGPGRRLGACHGIEIPFVFDALRHPALRALFPIAGRARHLSKRMQRAWIEFARSGDPGHDDLPDWPVYGAERAATMRLAPRCRGEDAPFAAAVRFWSDVEASGRTGPPPPG